MKFAPVADHGLLVEFAHERDAYGHVQALDHALRQLAPAEIIDVTPALVNLLIRFDPLVTDHQRIVDIVTSLPIGATVASAPATHTVRVSYGGEHGADLDDVARLAGCSADEVIDAHVGRPLQVKMFGFAPGYAYLGEIDQRIRLARKPEPVRNVAAGTVIIANDQCLITTIAMPTGWWRIGYTDTRVLTAADTRPVLFEPGDIIEFTRASS